MTPSTPSRHHPDHRPSDDRLVPGAQLAYPVRHLGAPANQKAVPIPFTSTFTRWPWCLSPRPSSGREADSAARRRTDAIQAFFAHPAFFARQESPPPARPPFLFAESPPATAAHHRHGGTLSATAESRYPAVRHRPARRRTKEPAKGQNDKCANERRGNKT